MVWNFHQYYANRSDGLIGKLRLDEAHTTSLKRLRSLVRSRIKDVFDEAKTIARMCERNNFTFESVKIEVSKSLLRYLTPETQTEITRLLSTMDEKARKSFISLNPRFRTQGSFQYDTLNKPYVTPPQEMDIDDGTYLPMELFDERPVIGHRLLILLVDSALLSLVAENNNWKFTPKRTCARLQIPQHNTHIDVPMYAVPADQFKQKEAALKAQLSFSDSYININELLTGRESQYQLDSNSVNLAVREGEEKWIKSDPKIVEDWFNESCIRIGKHLRSLCRFMKSWRDVQWSDGGPSSIALMTATVNVLDSYPHDKSDMDSAMRLLVEKLPVEFTSGIKSPDPTSDSFLFPPSHQHGVDEIDVMGKLDLLKVTINSAYKALTKSEALDMMSQMFGAWVTNSELIIAKQATPAFTNEPTLTAKPKRISPTMSSG
ncbi:MAG: hypothetical protein HUJ16_06545 [Kangiella sp.]|uniref:CBASS cGAMP synthase n=1 Tax=Methylophaga sp. TaxID=2024840 RepID=UPI0013FEFEC3|nr:CBASS cGAMP synthase [Methylophaga sp.]MBD3667601.1 hypothetical protein [Kangiella sp.]MTI64717.1 hypothetical protein [Methylophaga sp.]